VTLISKQENPQKHSVTNLVPSSILMQRSTLLLQKKAKWFKARLMIWLMSILP